MPNARRRPAPPSLPPSRAGRALALALAAAALAACGPAEEREAPRRIVLFSMDTVRADAVAGFGGEESRTPHLAELAAEGIRLPRFYAATNYTLPSHMSIFTGLDPVAHGVYVGAARLSPEVPTLAELLAEGGYRTHSFNEAGFVAARFGFDRGFERYVELAPRQVAEPALPHVLDWMREHRDEPYFLFLHTYEAHAPYGGYARYREAHPERGLLSEARLRELREERPRKREDLGRAAGGFDAETRRQCTLYNQLAPSYGDRLGCGYNWLPRDYPESPHFEEDLAAIRRSYAARVENVDRAVGRVRETLEALGQWRDTLLVVTSDHGEAFFEHGLYQHDFGPFDEVMRVPLLLAWPEGLGERAGERVETPAWHPDLLPTILGLAGLEAPAGLHGRDLSPLVRGEAGEAPAVRLFPAVMSAPNRPRRPTRRVVLDWPLKLIQGYPAWGDGGDLLFDLAEDPGETRNLRARRTRAAAELAARALRHDRRLEIRRPVHADTGATIDPTGRAPHAPAELPPELREQLEGLGYVGGDP